uniref:glutathione transferase n=1 Tax=Oryctolagus cuniculus TaxID=9986 RepID=A0A5F9CRZ5_RABIT
MSRKPILHYYNARGRMESIRWLLATVGVEFEEKFVKTRAELDKLRNDGILMFQQVPMVEIDGMKLVQSRAILNYIASKHDLYGKDIKERALIDMYTEGMADLGELVLHHPYLPLGEQQASLAQIKDKARNRYFPAFEKVRGKSSLSQKGTITQHFKSRHLSQSWGLESTGQGRHWQIQYPERCASWLLDGRFLTPSHMVDRLRGVIWG